MEVKIASVSALAPGEMMGIDKQGKSILLVNLNGTFYAIGNICMHQGCSLDGGTLTGEKIECPCHGSTYDVRSGKVLQGPAEKPEPSYPVRVQGDAVLATL